MDDKKPAEPVIDVMLVDLASIESVTLRRLIEEVRQENGPVRNVYNRSYNRHNRS
jgi:hypothetical protein